MAVMFVLTGMEGLCRAADWPQWGGHDPGRNMVSPGASAVVGVPARVRSTIWLIVGVSAGVTVITEVSRNPPDHATSRAVPSAVAQNVPSASSSLPAWPRPTWM